MLLKERTALVTGAGRLGQATAAAIIREGGHVILADRDKAEYGKALKCQDDAIKLEPGYSLGYRARGLVYESMARMKKMQPEMVRIKELHKDDPQRQQKEIFDKAGQARRLFGNDADRLAILGAGPFWAAQRHVGRRANNRDRRPKLVRCVRHEPALRFDHRPQRGPR